MATVRSGSTSRASAAGAVQLEVRSWPIRDEGVRGWLPVALVLVASAVAGISLSSFEGAALVVVLGSAAVWRAWLPIRYSLDRRGLVQHSIAGERPIAWRAIAGYRVQPQGVLLLRTPSPGLLDFEQALFVPWGGKREELLAALELYVGSARKQDT